jgi:hypothetical protein
LRTLSWPPEWFGTGKLQHGWIVSEVLEQRPGRRRDGENDGRGTLRREKLVTRRRHRIGGRDGVVMGEMKEMSEVGGGGERVVVELQKRDASISVGGPQPRSAPSIMSISAASRQPASPPLTRCLS